MSELLEIWKRISEKQRGNLPIEFIEAVDGAFAAASGDNREILPTFREVEFGYSEPLIRPDAHCASIGALLCQVTTLKYLSGHYGFAMYQQLDPNRLPHAYFARYLILSVIESCLSAIVKLLSSRNEPAIRTLARTNLEACEYLLVIPRDTELSKTFNSDKTQFKYTWAKKLRPTKIRSKRAAAINSCALLSPNGNELNSYFDEGHRYLSMSSHPSSFGALASLWAAADETKLPTERTQTHYLMSSSVELSCFPVVSAIVSDIEFQRKNTSNRISKIEVEMLSALRDEMIGVFRGLSPILERGRNK